MARLWLFQQSQLQGRVTTDPPKDCRAVGCAEERGVGEHLSAVPKLPDLIRVLLLLRNPRGIEVRQCRRAQVSSREGVPGGSSQIFPGCRTVAGRVGERRGLIQAPEPERILRTPKLR